MQLAIDAPSILVCSKAVDFRKSIQGLVDIILTELGEDARKHIFVFYNRSRDKIKLVAWHKNGFILLLKRLEQGTFCGGPGGVLSITPQQLSWLLAGLDWVKMTAWGELEYRDFR